ncbi:predicted protein, partial [Nematostella vectensis]
MDFESPAEVRQRALHLAAEVAETEDSNVPVLLLGLRDILECSPVKSELGTIIRIDLWTYDLIHVTNLALRQDFNAIQGQWSTAANLSVLLCQCCVGLDLPEVEEYERAFLPSVLESVLTVASKIHDIFSKETLDEDRSYYLHHVKNIFSWLQQLISAHAHLATKFVQSKRLLQMLMTEDPQVGLIIMSVLEDIWKSNRLGTILDELSPPSLHSILDEIIFKLSASDDTSIGRTSTHLVLTAAKCNQSVVQILLSKRYRGVKAYLSKWRGRGFDSDVKHLIGLLEAGTAAQAEQMKFSSAATTIQSGFRGYKTRKQLELAKAGMTKLQRLFRQKRDLKIREAERVKEEENRKHLAEQKRIQEFRCSMKKQLKLLETVPAREVNKHMQENQIAAATTIQAAYRGMRCRRQAQHVRTHLLRVRAAIRIQRQIILFPVQFRRYRKGKEDKPPHPFLSGLTDARRVELQEIIVQRRERFPPKHRTPVELKELHEKAHSLLSSHVMVAMKARRDEQRRDALMARLEMDSDHLLAAPGLEAAKTEVIDSYTSQSAPVITKAKMEHSAKLRYYKLPWWKKLNDE